MQSVPRRDYLVFWLLLGVPIDIRWRKLFVFQIAEPLLENNLGRKLLWRLVPALERPRQSLLFMGAYLSGAVPQSLASIVGLFAFGLESHNSNYNITVMISLVDPVGLELIVIILVGLPVIVRSVYQVLNKCLHLHRDKSTFSNFGGSLALKSFILNSLKHRTYFFRLDRISNFQRSSSLHCRILVKCWTNSV